jgi:hypothetical protein
MKNTLAFLAFALLISFSVSAQSTVDSIAAKYKLLPMPEAFTIEKAFPVLGVYQLASSEENSETPVSEIHVSLDTASKGIIWVEGLPQGKFKALLKQSPATYRIISQKTETGVQIPEGTLVFDPEANILQVAIGKSFNDQDPSAVFALNNGETNEVKTEVKVKTKNTKVKEKTKIIFYTAHKTGVIQQADETTETAEETSSSF